MEGLVVSDWRNALRGKRVFLTGHSGFKGSWMAHWLIELGAEVVGFSIRPNTKPSHFDQLQLEMESVWGDLRDAEFLRTTVARVRPELVIHMAAQPLVRASYRDPVGTYATNVMGTLHLFEACRVTNSVRAIVNVTSDKCYENVGLERGYRETDPMGGSDIYSSSKGAAELLASSYRESFWPVSEYDDKHQVLLASVRAGNVIGGGDWAADRIVPDAIRAIDSGQTLMIRYPRSTRPWQHVLEPLRGYLMVAERLLSGQTGYAEGWNFGPRDENNVEVESLLEGLKKYAPALEWKVVPSDLKEAKLLRLDSTKAMAKLGWQPLFGFDQTLEMTAQWYESFRTGRIVTKDQIASYSAQVKG